MIELISLGRGVHYLSALLLLDTHLGVCVLLSVDCLQLDFVSNTAASFYLSIFTYICSVRKLE